mmetsp:Transcript_35352/g.103797  ORF Transcript_35352/g.103797 Transcript_35352/m.103797 type:complete len:318 (+) Transcript_35352:67-1020(+)
MLRSATRLLPRAAAGVAVAAAWSASRSHDQALCQLEVKGIETCVNGLPTTNPQGRALYGDGFLHLIKGATKKQYEAGEYFFRKGDRAQLFFVILSGEASVIDEDTSTVVDVLGPGCIFGESALLNNRDDRVRTLSARTGCEVLTVPKEALYKELRLARPELPTFPSREELVLAFIQMVVPSEAKYTRRVQFGEYIFRQGNRGDPALYIVNAGDFEVLHQEPHLAEVKVSSLGRGECFGYVSLLSENPFNPKRFTVRCTSRLGKGEILSINGADFHRLLDHSQVVSSLMSELKRTRDELNYSAMAKFGANKIHNWRGC